MIHYLQISFHIGMLRKDISEYMFYFYLDHWDKLQFYLSITVSPYTVCYLPVSLMLRGPVSVNWLS